jgi:predicted RNA binding protein YcfA (HicA-like mRNA interferase family)
MKLPRDLSGADVATVLCRHWGYREVHQVGSHLVLQTEEPTQHRISVPLHKSLRVGTLSGLLRDVADHKGVSRQTILETLR